MGISDSRGGIYNPKGLDIAKIVAIKQARGTVHDYIDATKMGEAEVLTQNCDILIPAALENQITQENAKNIQAKWILELANGPTTPDADAILEGKGVSVIPDILANSGGVMVSYFEQVQNNTNYYWTEEEVDAKLHKKITDAAASVFHTSKEYSSSLRDAAYIIAMKRIFDAMKDRGEI